MGRDNNQLNTQYECEFSAGIGTHNINEKDNKIYNSLNSASKNGMHREITSGSFKA